MHPLKKISISLEEPFWVWTLAACDMQSLTHPDKSTRETYRYIAREILIAIAANFKPIETETPRQWVSDEQDEAP